MSQPVPLRHTGPGGQVWEEALLRLSFPYYLAAVWSCKAGYGHPPFHQDDMARWLQEGPPRKGIEAKRKFAKSDIAIVYATWKVRRDFRRKVLIISKSGDQARKAMRGIKLILQMPFNAHLYPRPDQIQGDETGVDINGATGKTEQPSFIARGISEQITGMAPTDLVADDVETPENTATQTMRNRLFERVTEVENAMTELEEATDPVTGQTLSGRSEAVYLFTRHHRVDSVYDKLAKGAYRWRTWPALYPTPEERERLPYLSPSIDRRLAEGKNKPGDPLWPALWPRQILDELRASIGKHSWEQQQMCLATPKGESGLALRLADLIVPDMAFSPDRAPSWIVWGTRSSNVSTMWPAHDDVDRDGSRGIPNCGYEDDALYREMDRSSEWVPYSRTAAVIDPAWEGEDRTAWAIGSELNSMYWIHAVGGERRSFGNVDFREEIAFRLRHWGVSEVVLESNMAQGMESIFQGDVNRLALRPGEADKDGRIYPRGWSCRVLSQPRTGSLSKNERNVATIAGLTGDHRVVVNPDVLRGPGAEPGGFQQQYVLLTGEHHCLDHDDEIDAFAELLRQLQTSMASDRRELARRSEDRARLREIEQFRQEIAARLGGHEDRAWWEY